MIIISNSGWLAKIIRRHTLSSFFIIVYVISWALWLPMLIFNLPVFSVLTNAPTIFILPGISLGVTGSTLLVTAMTQGKTGVLQLLKGFVRWRFKLHWYAIAIFGIPTVEVFIGYLLPGRDGVLKTFYPESLLLYPAAYISHFYFGPLWEEAGWRGFALPRLQKKFGPLMGTLVLGFFWGLWHLPIYIPINISESGAAGGSINFAIFVLTAILLTIIFTWVFNNTKGSILSVILLHASIDCTSTYIHTLADRHLISATAVENIQSGFVLGCFAIAMLLIIFTKGKLGYNHYKKTVEPQFH